MNSPSLSFLVQFTTAVTAPSSQLACSRAQEHPRLCATSIESALAIGLSND